jgi:[acyl-carrier-protein] S-malonyltransferase
MSIAFIFPGQGSQCVGMGRQFYTDCPETLSIFEQFNQWVSPDLTHIMFEGPEETLKQTLYTQPAILAVSIAAYTAFKAQVPTIQPAYLAGHSLGEYAALFAAGVLNLESVATLVKRRAELMQDAPAGAMSAVLGLNAEQVEAAVAEVKTGIVTVANYNTPEQFVISGEVSAVAQASENALKLGASKVISLPVGGAFHSPLMQEASTVFTTDLAAYSFQPASTPVLTNIDAEPTFSGFQDKLARQISGSVRWVQSVEYMLADGVDTFIEMGPGKVLSGMIKKTNRRACVYSISDRDSLEKTVEALQNAHQKEGVPL